MLFIAQAGLDQWTTAFLRLLKNDFVITERSQKSIHDVRIKLHSKVRLTDIVLKALEAEIIMILRKWSV